MDFVVSYIETWTMGDGTGEVLDYEHDNVYIEDDADCHELAVFIKAFRVNFSSVRLMR